MTETNREAHTRGVRNNNPGNIRSSPFYNWKGQTGEDEYGFCTFTSATYGIRAIFMILRHYQAYYGARTVAELISRYAPPSDHNPTSAYARYVAGKCGIDPSTEIVHNLGQTCIVRAIVEFENGYQPYVPSTYDDAYRLASET